MLQKIWEITQQPGGLLNHLANHSLLWWLSGEENSKFSRLFFVKSHIWVHGATSVEGPVGYFQATNCLPLYVSGTIWYSLFHVA